MGMRLLTSCIVLSGGPAVSNRPLCLSSSFFRLLNAISLKCQMPKLHCAFCFLGSSRGVDLGRDHIETRAGRFAGGRVRG